MIIKDLIIALLHQGDLYGLDREVLMVFDGGIGPNTNPILQVYLDETTSASPFIALKE